MSKHIFISDARRLSPDAQEDLRRRAVRAVVEEQKTQTEVAQTLGVSRKSVNTWVKSYREQGPDGLTSKPHGAPPRPRLPGEQTEAVVTLIAENTPDQLGLSSALWTREAVRELLAEHFDVSVSVRTVGRYLKQWGLSPQKPLRRAYEQDPDEVQRWLSYRYPQIRRRAREQGAEIHWGDQMGIRSDHQTGTSYGLVGQTPSVPGTGKRFRINMISTITNRGDLAFLLFRQNFTAEVMVWFLEHLLQHVRRQVFLIVDQHPVHDSKKVKRFLKDHRERIRLYQLPTYSPDRNPDELLNQDVKSNAAGRQRPQNLDELEANVSDYLWDLQQQPELVRNYFEHPLVTYAA